MLRKKFVAFVLAVVFVVQVCVPAAAYAIGPWSLPPTNTSGSNNTDDTQNDANEPTVGTPASGVTASGAATPSAASYAYGNPACGITPITFRYAGDPKGLVDRDETCYFDDSFFAADSTTYNPSLATASVCLAMASFGSNDALNAKPLDLTKQAQNGIGFLQKCGFNKVEANSEYNGKAGADTIGVIVGYKLIGETPLIAVGVRGGNYTAEWGGNFLMGDISNTVAGVSGEHEGFSIAANTVINYVSSYIKAKLPDYQGKIKLWISGFSRAGATSNLTAAKLVRAAVDANKTVSPHPLGSGISLPVENIYAYTFATPSGGIKVNRVADKYVDSYKVIRNIFTQHDLVPLVAPNSKSFDNFGQYGTNYYLPTRETYAGYSSLVSRVVPRLIDNKSYALDDFVSYSFRFNWPPYEKNEAGLKTQSIFYNNFVNLLANNALVSREGYLENGKYNQSYQEAIRTIVQRLMGGDVQLNQFQFGTLFKAWFKQIISSWSSVGNLLRALFSFDVYTIEKYFIKSFDEAVAKLGAPYNKFNGTDIIKGVPSLIQLIARLVVGDKNAVITLYGDTMGRGGITQAHDPELIKRWLELMDPCYYADSARLDYKDIFLCGEYRKVVITTDDSMQDFRVTVKQLDTNELVADFEAAEMDTTSTNDRVSTYITDAEEYCILLPVNAAYSVEVFSKNKWDNQYFDCSLYEVSPSVEPGVNDRVKRVCRWEQVTVKRQTSLNITVPAFDKADWTKGLPNGSDCAYTLTYNGSVRNMTSKKLSELNASYKIVSVSSTEPTYGSAWGGGTYLIDGRVALSAAPLQNGRFVGWYKEGETSGTPVCKEPDYIFTLTGTSPDKYAAKFGFNGIPQNVTARLFRDSTDFVMVRWEAPSSELQQRADAASLASYTDMPTFVSAAEIAYYNVYRNGAFVDKVMASELKYVDQTPLDPGKTYTYTVTAVTSKNVDPDCKESNRSKGADVTGGAPSLPKETVKLATGVVGAAYSATLPCERASGFTIVDGALPVGLALDANTGAITGTPTVPGTQDFTVSFSNQYDAVCEDYSISIASADGAPVIVTGDIDGLLGGQTSPLVVLPTANADPVEWTMTGNPDGLTLSADNKLAASESLYGAFEITLTAKNSKGSDTRTINLVIARKDGVPVITTQQSQMKRGNSGDAYSMQLEAVGAGPFFWYISDGNLPAGVTLDENTGLLNGTPTSGGTYMFTVSCDNSIDYCRKEFFITVSGKDTRPINDTPFVYPKEVRVTLTPGSTLTENGSYRFKVGLPLYRLVVVCIDYELIPRANYNAYNYTDGDLIIELHPDFLATLPEGQHLMHINFTENAYAEATFIVPKAAS